jgi:hypothetical protein
MYVSRYDEERIVKKVRERILRSKPPLLEVIICSKPSVFHGSSNLLRLE